MSENAFIDLSASFASFGCVGGRKLRSEQLEPKVLNSCIYQAHFRSLGVSIRSNTFIFMPKLYISFGLVSTVSVWPLQLYSSHMVVSIIFTATELRRYNEYMSG